MSGNEPIAVRHNLAARRFEIEQNGHLATLEYELADNQIIFTHTNVPQPLGGQGIGSRLARAGLDYANDNKVKVIPLCSFIDGYIKKHPEYQGLTK
jgi:hypothetical protein